MTSRLRKLAALTLVLLAPSATFAFNFTPTEAEWAVWPDYCKARYVTTTWGGTTQFANAFPRSQAEVWTKRMGEETFVGIHHYCAGITSTQRALMEPDPRARRVLLDYAHDNTSFSLRRTQPSNPMYVKMVLNLAVIENKLGNVDKAIEHAQQAMEAQPKNPESYVALAQIYFALNKKEQARDVLLRGNEAVGGESAEVHYNLGLVEADLGALDSAQEHAKQAYALGHPLPGLKRKLQRLGAWAE